MHFAPSHVLRAPGNERPARRGNLQVGAARFEHRAGRKGRLHAARKLCQDPANRTIGRCGANEPIVVPSALQCTDLHDAASVSEATAPSGGEAPDGIRGGQHSGSYLQGWLGERFAVQSGILADVWPRSEAGRHEAAAPV